MKQHNPLNPLLGNIQKFEESENQLKQWESSRVEWTLRRLKLDSQRKEIWKVSQAGQYTFDELRRVVPSFPVYLVAEPMPNALPLHRDPRSIHPLWFKAFLSLPIVQRYESQFEEFYAKVKEQPFGLVFPRKGFAQGLIIHNGDWEKFVPLQSSCHIFKGGKKHAMTLLVQPYSSFVDTVRDNFGHLFKG